MAACKVIILKGIYQIWKHYHALLRGEAWCVQSGMQDEEQKNKKICTHNSVLKLRSTAWDCIHGQIGSSQLKCNRRASNMSFSVDWFWHCNKTWPPENSSAISDQWEGRKIKTAEQLNFSDFDWSSTTNMSTRDDAMDVIPAVGPWNPTARFSMW